MKKIIKDYVYFIRKSMELDKKYFLYFFGDVLFQIISPFSLVVFPRYILNEISTERRVNYIVIGIICMVAIDIIINSIVQILSPLLNNRIHYLRNKMSIEFSNKVLDLDYEKIEDPKIIDMKQKAIEFIYGSDGLENVTFSAERILISFGQIIGYGYILSHCNIVIIMLIIFCAFLTAKWHGKAEEYSYNANNEVLRENRQGSYLDFVCSDYEHYKDIRIFELKNWILEKKNYYNDIKLKVFSKTSKQFIKLGLITTVMNNILSILYYSYLIFLLFVGRIYIGDFTMYLSSITNFSATINGLSIAFSRIVQADLRLSNYISFMNLENRMNILNKDKESIKFDENFTLEFRNVSFKYPYSEEWSLKNITVAIKSGEKISIVGENGAGKTTFIKLLMRLYDPTEGGIYYNNIDIRDIEYLDYIKIFSSVFQDYHLFPFSIKENIVFDQSENISDKIVEKLLFEVGLKDKLQGLPRGIHTGLSKQFDENGTDLSGGESQKIAIARAIFRDASVIILDEPTSALDPISEYEIYQKYNEMVSGKTSIFISHRMASTRLSDKIIVLNNGELVEYGTHNMLMKQKGNYCKMYELQKEYYE